MANYYDKKKRREGYTYTKKNGKVVVVPAHEVTYRYRERSAREIRNKNRIAGSSKQLIQPKMFEYGDRVKYKLSGIEGVVTNVWQEKKIIDIMQDYPLGHHEYGVSYDKVEKVLDVIEQSIYIKKGTFDLNIANRSKPQQTMVKEIPYNMLKGIREISRFSPYEYSFAIDFEREDSNPERLYIMKGAKDYTLKLNDFELFGHTHPDHMFPLPSRGDISNLEVMKPEFILTPTTAQTIIMNIEDPEQLARFLKTDISTYQLSKKIINNYFKNDKRYKNLIADPLLLLKYSAGRLLFEAETGVRTYSLDPSNWDKAKFRVELLDDPHPDKLIGGRRELSVHKLHQYTTLKEQEAKLLNKIELSDVADEELIKKYDALVRKKTNVYNSWIDEYNLSHLKLSPTTDLDKFLGMKKSKKEEIKPFELKDFVDKSKVVDKSLENFKTSQSQKGILGFAGVNEKAMDLGLSAKEQSKYKKLSNFK
ncbi:MAG: hypothetical protein U9Q73_01930 [Nanoarchaeota archaeon]|nr:hypothetical protein [Nanoarchaeota archaeon]